MDPVEREAGMNTENDDQAVQERDGGADARPDATQLLDPAHRDPTGGAVDETTTMARGSTIIADPSDLGLSQHGEDLAALALIHDGDALLDDPAPPSDSAIISASTEHAAPITDDIHGETVDHGALLLADDTDHLHHDALPVDDTHQFHHHDAALLDADPMPAMHHLIPPPPPTRVASHVSDSTAHTKSILMFSIDKVVAAAAAAHAEHAEKEPAASDREDEAADGADEIKLTAANEQHEAPMQVQDASVAENDTSLAPSASDSLLAPAASFTHDDKGHHTHHHDRQGTVRPTPETESILFNQWLSALADGNSSLCDGLHEHFDQQFPMFSWLRELGNSENRPLDAPAAAIGAQGVVPSTGHSTQTNDQAIPSNDITPAGGSVRDRDRRRAPSVTRRTRRQAALSPYAATRPIGTNKRTSARQFRDYPPHHHHQHITSPFSISTALLAGLTALLAVTIVVCIGFVVPVLRRGMDIPVPAAAVQQFQTSAPVTLTETVSVAAPTVTVTSIILDAATTTQTEVVVHTATVTATATVVLHANDDGMHSALEPTAETVLGDDRDTTVQEPSPLHVVDKGMQMLNQVRASAVNTWAAAAAKWDQSRAREVLHAAAVTVEVVARHSWARARACAEDPRACADAVVTAAADRGRATWTAVRDAVGKGVPAAWARVRGYAKDAEEGEEVEKDVHADEDVESAPSTEEEPAPAKTYVIDPRVQAILDMDRAMAASIELELGAIRASMDARYSEQRARQEQSVAAKIERAWRYMAEWTSTVVFRRDLGAAEDDDEGDEDVVLVGEDVLVTA
ncbi:hypothetical protein AMAG_13829 [Allomyces macrogynus ATCC 38327]|uniref:Transmembrane protein n=1 Tax=Allomyces macrogynus (strain ATCC 38327) TaxID=578462 RepID=A0A0L0T2U4_ALLM3|nr:hypothetical protein AMAG_13829 [Allomyces macrogynus ATCC 38327]|eukprot:KNE68955.1 hypothetical protein AMAG_13829 [Allomyces macrogynus ATCC 38327]